MARNAREEIVRVWRVVGCAWTWGIILVLALGLVGQLVRDRAVWLALLMYLPILPVGILAFVQDLVQKGRAMPRVRFGLTMLALMAIIWTIAHMAGSGRGVEAPSDSGETVRLVQWNVMWGTRGRANWWSTVVDDVAGQRPDIVILNEGPSEPFLEALLTRLGPGWNSIVSKDSMRHPGYWYNLAICSRWPVQKLDEQPIATGQIQRAVIHSPGGPIRVLQVDGTSDPRHPRRGRLGDVARSVQQAHDAGEDIDIIAGDFNTVSRSVGFEQIEDAGPAFNRASDHASWRGTWPSIFPLYDIDHVFVSSRWRTGSDEMLFNRHLDHRGQVVVLAPVVPAAAWHTPPRPLGFAREIADDPADRP